MSLKLQVLYLLLFFLSCLFLPLSFDTDLFQPDAQQIRSAYKGNPEEQISLADFYCREKGCKCAKCEKADFWYKQAIKNNSFEVQNKILKKYLNGDEFLTKDIIYKLSDKYQKWAKAGDIKAQKLLIDLSSKNLIPKNDYIQSLYNKWQDDSYMMFDQILKKHNLKIDKDNKKIIKLFNNLALENNNIRFKCEIWNRGISDTDQNRYDKSKFEKALLNECPQALLLYGYLLLNDWSDMKYYKEIYESGVFPSDEQKKKKKVIEAFEQLSRNKWDSVYHWFDIGDSFSYKINKEKIKIEKYDFKLAVKFYKKAYNLGADPKTAYEIGLLYKKGDKNLTKNNSKAFEWFYKSAVQNYMPAQLEVGYMYSHGLGVEKNQKSAIKWLKKAHNHNLFACSVCYKTEIMLNNLGFINFFTNIKQIYEF